MNVTSKYLDQVKAALALPSDNQLASLWKVSRQRIAEYRRGDTAFSDDRCIQVAAILGCNPAAVILTVSAERARRTRREAAALVYEAILAHISECPAFNPIPNAESCPCKDAPCI